MKIATASLLSLVVGTSGLYSAVRAQAQATNVCESLRNLAVENGEVTRAEQVPAGMFVDGGANPETAALFKTLPSFCRVGLQLSPSADSNIGVEVWLPDERWNGKFEAVGNGGLGGSIAFAPMASALAAGYAVAGTDTGHQGRTADFVVEHPERFVDFGYRAIHEMTVAAKKVVTSRYDRAPQRAYFYGCSTGGRQALVEAQRFPSDFDGIVAGASAWDQMRLYAARIALNLFVNRSSEASIPPSKYPAISRAVLNACDAADGVRDGVIEDPSTCRFDYASLACTGADEATCLTKEQAESAKAMVSPITDRASGTVLFGGRLYPGTELGWNALGGPRPCAECLEAMQKIVFSPTWDYHDLRVPEDIERAVRADGGLLYGGDPDLAPFFRRGGKLLMYHGWADPVVTPDASLSMFQRIKDSTNGLSDDSMALFMVPGMTHCQGGTGTDVFDKVAALDQWVESGRRPSAIIASRVAAGLVQRTRPLCPYPQTATYLGVGSSDQAENFRCHVK